MVSLDRILIVGGGIAGLTAAAALRAVGYQPEIVERSESWRVVGGGIMVHGNGMRVLRSLRIHQAVEELGAAVSRWVFCDVAGVPLCGTDLSTLWGPVGPCIGIERTKLQQVLRAAAGPTPVRLGLSISSLQRQGRGVRVGLSDRSSATYDLVVGADGIASTVRELLQLSTPLIYSGQMVWRSVAPVRPGGSTELQFHLGDASFFGLCPVGGGRTYGFGNVTMPRAYDPLDGRVERLRERFAGFGGRVREFLDHLDRDEQVHCAPIEWLELEKWYAGPVVLIGDAAHASSPMMGQGGCMGMEDAWVLAQALSSSSTLVAALRAYVHRRRPRIDWVHQQSRDAGESLRLRPAVRDAFLREHGDRMLRRRFGPLLPAP